MDKDSAILRELAKEILEITHQPIQEERRDLWRRHHNYERVRPLIYVRAFAFDEFFDKNRLRCEDPFLRSYEYWMHMMKFRDTINDDFIIEPWLTVDAVYDPPPELCWGVEVKMGEKPNASGAAAFSPTILEEGDLEKLQIPTHCINEQATKIRVERLVDAVGDLLTVDLNRGPMLRMWSGDISTDIGKIRGLEQIMWDAYDRPKWLHRLLAWMRDGVLKVQEEAEMAGDYSLTNHQNQAMPYAAELQDPKPNVFGIKRNQLWWYMAAQEFTTFGPDMFYEFMLHYQIPILEKYGLVAYGCCEDLTNKIGYLRKIPNLRRIAISPFANARKCAEQIGEDYILSWRPNPSDMISTGLDEQHVRSVMLEHFHIFRENSCYFDITLKDVETIRSQPKNVLRWVEIVRQTAEDF